MNKAWRKLKVCRADLQLGPTLGGGQSFRWKNTENDNWIGVFKNRVWILSQEDNQLLYKTFDKESNHDKVEESDKETENMLKSYFRLDVDLNEYYKVWSEADPCFREAAPKMFGIRILNQDVTENIFSFICSSNNNIKRISSMIEKLCKLYGEEIGEVNSEKFYCFPTVERLSENSVETVLKAAGFGYRAKFIHKSACLIKQMGGSVWLENLKLLPYNDAKKELIKLPGIGAKVADCICLMSLGHMEAVPVDTHIFQVATTMYLPHLKKYKTLTEKVYNEIGDHFRSLHGLYAGWANTVLADKEGSFRPYLNSNNGHEVLGQRKSMMFENYLKSLGGFGHYPELLKKDTTRLFVQPLEQSIHGPKDVQQHFENVESHMEEFSTKVYEEFQKTENEIDRNRKQIEEVMKNQFQTLELVLESKQEEEIQQAVKNGKDEVKLQECLAESEHDVRTDMNANIQKAVDCVNDATQGARRALYFARNTFTQSFEMYSADIENSAYWTESCAVKKDNNCVRSGINFSNRKAKHTVQQGTRYVQEIQELPQRQIMQMDYCLENFMDNLKDMRTAYSKMVQQCLTGPEIQEPEEEAPKKEETPVEEE